MGASNKTNWKYVSLFDEEMLAVDFDFMKTVPKLSGFRTRLTILLVFKYTDLYLSQFVESFCNLLMRVTALFRFLLASSSDVKHSNLNCYICLDTCVYINLIKRFRFDVLYLREQRNSVVNNNKRKNSRIADFRQINVIILYNWYNEIYIIRKLMRHAEI